MVAIRAEIDRVGSGEWPADDNPLHNAPHTVADVTTNEWEHAYTREEAASLRPDKYFPPVSRIDSVYGDRNVFCSCPPIEAYS
jgi:glycine dehydrogenase